MTDEKPLDVRVAEALGWSDARLDGDTWWGHCSYDRGDELKVPRYDTDWSATGPLIERYSFDLYRKVGLGPWSAAAWLPNDNPTENKRVEGETPLIAVCNLILALHAAGKL